MEQDNNGPPPTDSQRAKPEDDLPWPGFIGTYTPPAPYLVLRLIEGGRDHEPLEHRQTISPPGKSPLRLVDGSPDLEPIAPSRFRPEAMREGAKKRNNEA